ncbi:hypothetical protein Ddc_15265 [Ditylenchus destructor]|nr:hypothetical protein Ddc_15265 [Ditylenchus destructor]
MNTKVIFATFTILALCIQETIQDDVCKENEELVDVWPGKECERTCWMPDAICLADEINHHCRCAEGFVRGENDKYPDNAPCVPKKPYCDGSFAGSCSVGDLMHRTFANYTINNGPKCGQGTQGGDQVTYIIPLIPITVWRTITIWKARPVHTSEEMGLDLARDTKLLKQFLELRIVNEDHGSQSSSDDLMNGATENICCISVGGRSSENATRDKPSPRQKPITNHRQVHKLRSQIEKPDNNEWPCFMPLEESKFRCKMNWTLDCVSVDSSLSVNSAPPRRYSNFPLTSYSQEVLRTGQSPLRDDIANFLYNDMKTLHVSSL